MNGNTCYAGNHSGSDAPVIPSLLRLDLMKVPGFRLFGESKDNKGKVGVNGQWSNGTCNGPCAPEALIADVFADER